MNHQDTKDTKSPYFSPKEKELLGVLGVLVVRRS